MEPEPSISRQAYFSTNGGKWAPQPIPAVRSHAIVRGDVPDIDGRDEYVARLRREFPKKCKEILKPPDRPYGIYDYFDGKDISIHSAKYLFAILDRIAGENLHRIQKLELFVENWMNSNGNLFWSLAERPTVQEIFSQTDIDEYCKEWLEDSLERIWSRRAHEAANGMFGSRRSLPLLTCQSPGHPTHAQLPDRGNFHSDPEQWVRDHVNEDQMQNIPSATPKDIVSTVWAGNPSSQIQSHRARPQSGEVDLYSVPPPQPRPRRLPVPMPVSNDARVLEDIEAQKVREKQLTLASGSVKLGLPVIPESSRSPCEEGYQSQEPLENNQFVDQSLFHGPLAIDQDANPPYSSINSSIDLAPAAGLRVGNHQRERSVPRVQPLHARPLARGPVLTPLLTPALPPAIKPSKTRQYPIPYPSYYGPQPQPPQSPNYPLPSDGPLSSYQRRRSGSGQSRLSSQGMNNRRASSASEEFGHIQQQRDSSCRNTIDQSIFECRKLWVGQAAAAMENVNCVKIALLGGRELSVDYAYPTAQDQYVSSFYSHPSDSQQWSNSFNQVIPYEPVPLALGSRSASAASRTPSQQNHGPVQDFSRGAAGPSYVGKEEVVVHMDYGFNQPSALEATSLPNWSQPTAQLSKVTQEHSIEFPTSTTSLQSEMETALLDHANQGLTEHINSQAYNEHAPQPALGDDTAADARSQASEVREVLHERQDQIEERSKSNVSRGSESFPGPNELEVTARDFACKSPNIIIEPSSNVQKEHVQHDSPVAESPTQSMIGLREAPDPTNVDVSTTRTLIDRPDLESNQSANMKQAEDGLDPSPKLGTKGAQGPEGGKDKIEASNTTEGTVQNFKQPPAMDMTSIYSESAADRPVKDGQPVKIWKQPPKNKSKQRRASSSQQEASAIPISSTVSASQTFAQEKPMVEVMNDQIFDKIPPEGSASQEMTRGDSSSSHEVTQTPAQGVMSTQPTTYAPSEVSETENLAIQEQRTVTTRYDGYEKKQTSREGLKTGKRDPNETMYEAYGTTGENESTTAKEHPRYPRQSSKKLLPTITPAVPDFDKIRQLHRDEQRLQRIQQRLESVATGEALQSLSAKRDDSKLRTSHSTSDKAPNSLPVEKAEQFVGRAKLRSNGIKLTPSFERDDTADEETLFHVEDTALPNESSPDQVDSINTLCKSASEETPLNILGETKRSESEVSSDSEKVGSFSSTEAAAPAEGLQEESKAEAVLNLMPTDLEDSEPDVALNVGAQASPVESEMVSVGPIVTHKRRKVREGTLSQDHLASLEPKSTCDDNLGHLTGSNDSIDISQEKSNTEFETQRQDSPDTVQEQSVSHTKSELGEEPQPPTSIGAGTPRGSVMRKKRKNKPKRKKPKSSSINTPTEAKSSTINTLSEAAGPKKNLPAPEMPYQIDPDPSTARQAPIHERQPRLETSKEQINPHFVSFSRAADDYYGQKNATYLPWFPSEMNSALAVGSDKDDSDPQDEESSSKLSPESRARDIAQAMKDCGYIIEEVVDDEELEGDDEMGQDDFSEQKDKPQPTSMFTSDEFTVLSALGNLTRTTIIENHGDQDRSTILNELPADIVESYIEGSLTRDSARFQSLEESVKTKVKRLAALDLREAYLRTMRENDDCSSDSPSTPDDDHSVSPDLNTTVEATVTLATSRVSRDTGGGEASRTRPSTAPQKENERPTTDGPMAASISSSNIHAPQEFVRIKHGDGSEEVIPAVEKSVRATVVAPDPTSDHPSSVSTAPEEKIVPEGAANDIKASSGTRSAPNYVLNGIIYTKSPGTDDGYTIDYELHEDDEAVLDTEEYRFDYVTRNGAIVWKREGFDENAPPSSSTMKLNMGQLIFSKAGSLENGEIVAVSATEASALKRGQEQGPNSNVPVPNYFRHGVIYTKVPSTLHKYTIAYKLQPFDQSVMNCEDNCFDLVLRNREIVWAREGLKDIEDVDLINRCVFNFWLQPQNQDYKVGDIIEVVKGQGKANRNGDAKKRKRGLTREDKEKERPFLEKLPPPLETYLPERERGRSTGRRLGDLDWGVPRGEPAWGTGGRKR
ncbi:MAG: hypothetical protein Q9191_002661 [Dirinaria sp. TL-2023a]